MDFGQERRQITHVCYLQQTDQPHFCGRREAQSGFSDDALSTEHSRFDILWVRPAAYNNEPQLLWTS